MTTSTVLTVAGLTLKEAARRRVLWALAGMTVVLLTLSAWGFSELSGIEADGGSLTTGEERLVAAQVLNLVMFGLSLIAALGTAFLAGPTLSGEIESGQALAVLARPVRRSAVLVGKWLGLVTFGFQLWIPSNLQRLGFDEVTSSTILRDSALLGFPATFLIAFLYGFWSSKKTMILLSLITAASLLGFVVLAHALLEALQALGDVAHHVRKAPLPEQKQNDQADDEPMPEAETTH